MPKWGITALKWVAVVLLWMTAGIAGQGITLACHARNALAGGAHVQVAQLAQAEPEAAPLEPGYGSRLPDYLADFGWMVAWLVALGVFHVWTRKDKHGLAMTVIPLSAFGVHALGTWHYAWPVCNAF